MNERREGRKGERTSGEFCHEADQAIDMGSTPEKEQDVRGSAEEMKFEKTDSMSPTPNSADGGADYIAM
ncbi:hypothetical protein KIN20_022758 [Parelaphostrongylus tenuis]|uniref:Uncharacterized protein n=1 Tax=Parelaphostrongylus tenuis TaxID=148309 RepID=A0AAD5QSH7_PARTN|nr:hypothetical protein KIN20_019280 [Parelaphostrongylus tenuis]KAJ1363013.1 hypothetical protein KIN20_022758 [Parelaphostrongylus tenuis]